MLAKRYFCSGPCGTSKRLRIGTHEKCKDCIGWINGHEPKTCEEGNDGDKCHECLVELAEYAH